MGNKASKVGKEGGRVLSQNIKQETAHVARSSRPGLNERGKPVENDPSGDTALAERLQKLGPVQFKPIETKYKPASEDRFTLTLEARQKLEDESEIELEKKGPRKLVPAATITSILSSLKEGDSPERVLKAFNLDPSVLPKLELLSIPNRLNLETNGGSSQLLPNNNPTRQPVRRKRIEK